MIRATHHFNGRSMEYDYEPKNYIGVLDRFNIARCARERMTSHVADIHRWRGERRTFYTALQMMHTEDVGYCD